MLFRSGRNKQANSEWRQVLANPVGEGGRNNSIARLAGLLLGRGFDPHVSLDILLAFNDARHSPPLDPQEVIATVASIACREGRDRRRREDGRG